MLLKISHYRLVGISLCLSLLLSQMAQAETKEQKKLHSEISVLSTELVRQKKRFNEMNAEVTQLEKKLGDISRQQYETEKKITETIQHLEQENRRKIALEQSLLVQRSGMAQQLQAMYTAGEQSHLRMLLRQDNPADISRTLHYFDYLNQSRAQKINTIHTTIDEIRVLTKSMEKDRVYLSGLEETLTVQKRETQSTLQARETVMQRLNSDIRSKQSQLDRLHKQEAALQAEIDRIARKREAERRRQREAEKRRRSAAEAARQQQTIASRAQTSQPAAPTQAARHFRPGKPFSGLKGKLPKPVNGRIIHTYNSVRNEKQRWRGVVIAAPGGARVQAVASGRVVFSGWMDGYGHLIILEHDANYMSLYGYNRTVYKRLGQLVKAGDVIAAVGNSSGQRQNALYFEIRRRTTPQNPAQWFR